MKKTKAVDSICSFARQKKYTHNREKWGCQRVAPLVGGDLGHEGHPPYVYLGINEWCRTGGASLLVAGGAAGAAAAVQRF